MSTSADPLANLRPLAAGGHWLAGSIISGDSKTVLLVVDDELMVPVERYHAVVGEDDLRLHIVWSRTPYFDATLMSVLAKFDGAGVDLNLLFWLEEQLALTEALAQCETLGFVARSRASQPGEEIRGAVWRSFEDPDTVAAALAIPRTRFELEGNSWRVTRQTAPTYWWRPLVLESAAAADSAIERARELCDSEAAPWRAMERTLMFWADDPRALDFVDEVAAEYPPVWSPGASDIALTYARCLVSFMADALRNESVEALPELPQFETVHLRSRDVEWPPFYTTAFLYEDIAATEAAWQQVAERKEEAETQGLVEDFNFYGSRSVLDSGQVVLFVAAVTHRQRLHVIEIDWAPGEPVALTPEWQLGMLRRMGEVSSQVPEDAEIGIRVAPPVDL